MGEIDYGEIQQVLDDLLGQNVDFQNMAEQGASGNSPISFQNLLKMAEGLFFRELMEQKELWVHILILAIAAAVLLHFADVFQNKGVSRISFCMIYMMLFLLLITSFQGSMEITTNVLDAMKDFMTVLAPAFFLAMTLTSYISSAGIYYEFTLFLISGVRWLTSVFLLPCIEIYILLVLVNHLSGEKRLGHLAELLSMLVGWSLKALLALVCGFHMVQGLISPAADAFRTMSVSRGIEAIPGVGDAGSSATELVLGSAMLCCLLQIPNTGGMGENVHDCFQPFLRDNTFLFLQAHPLQYLRQCKSGENNLLLFLRIIRNIDHCKTGHERRTDLGFIIGSCDRVHTNCRHHTFHIIVRKSKVIEKRQKYISRISIAFS